MDDRSQPWADLQIDESGQLHPTGDAARAAFQLRQGLWQLTPSQEEVLLFQRVDGRPSDDRIALAGSIRETNLTDLVNFVHSTQRSGVVTVITHDVFKALLLEAGNVVSAMSNREEDRLGELLYRYGKISREDLDSALREVGGTRRLGKVLSDRALLNSHELWTFIRKQVEEIFYSLLLLEEGIFYFSVPGKPEHFPAHVPMSTQALLMEGVRRLDELRYFREMLPSPEVVIEPKWPAPQGLRLEPIEQMALRILQRPMTLAELSRATRLGEFEATKVVFHLLQAGALRKREDTEAPPPPTAEEERLSALIDTFNQIFREIFASISRTGRSDELRSGIASFLEAHGYGDLFQGVPLAATGELSRETLLGNLGQVQLESRTDYLYSSLNELLFFEIFQAREILGPDEEQALMNRVNALFQQLR